MGKGYYKKPHPHWDKVRHLRNLCGFLEGDHTAGIIHKFWTKTFSALHDRAVSGDETAIREAATELRRITRETRSTRPIETHVQRTVNEIQDDLDRPTTLVERVRIMLWAIRKCGDLESSKEAFRRAYLSVKESGDLG